MGRKKETASTPTDRLGQIRSLAQEVSKKMGRDGVVRVGADAKDLPYEKIDTGISALQYVTSGGLIRAACTELWGPEGGGKTSTLANLVAHAQRSGLFVAVALIETYDKKWWRDIGVFIPYSDQEIALMDKPAAVRARHYNATHQKNGLTPLTVLRARTGDTALGGVVKMVQSNLFDIVALDSIAAVVSGRLIDDRPFEEADEYGGESKLFARFARFVTSAFNMRYKKTGEPSPDGEIGNRTAFVATNQARVTFNTRARARHKVFHPPGGMALRHLWSASIFFDKVDGEAAEVEVDYDGRKRTEVVAQTVQVTATKMRGGPGAKEARFLLNLVDHFDEGGFFHQAGTVDNAVTLRALGVMLGIIQTSGAWYTFGEDRLHSKAAFDQFLRSHPEKARQLADAIAAEEEEE